MIPTNIDKDLAKELLIVLSYCDNSLINKIPDNFIKTLSEIASDSNKEYYIEKDKSLSNQNISEECKDLLSILYYIYEVNEIEKEDILNHWIKNEINSKD